MIHDHSELTDGIIYVFRRSINHEKLSLENKTNSAVVDGRKSEMLMQNAIR